MTTLREFRRWSRRQKLKSPLAGLRFGRRDSAGGLVIVARHWPHLLCWSWFVGLERRNSERHDGWPMFRVTLPWSWRHGAIGVFFARRWLLQLRWQGYAYMPAERFRHMRIDWAAEREHAA